MAEKGGAAGSRRASGLALGSAAAVTVTAAIAVAGKRETGDAWGPINDIAHAVVGEEKSRVRGFQGGVTLVGLGLHILTMEAFGILYQRLFRRRGFPRSLATAGAATFLLYLLDYHLVPKRLTPGFEHRLSRGSIYWIYGVLACTLALGDLRDAGPAAPAGADGRGDDGAGDA